jgi:membrane-associated protein
LELINTLIDFVLHIDKHLAEIILQYGTLTYLILFIIIFAETGFVVTPFLPGDSLLFAAGALAANEQTGLNIYLISLLLIVAAIGGNLTNYQIGRLIGPRAFEMDKWFLKKKNLVRTQEFFEKYGRMAIVISRFMPIIRTFAPFVAGVGKMDYKKFSLYNIIGGVSWVMMFLLVGYLFGNLQFVKEHFSYIVICIIIVSFIPVVVAFLKSRKSHD